MKTSIKAPIFLALTWALSCAPPPSPKVSGESDKVHEESTPSTLSSIPEPEPETIPVEPPPTPPPPPPCPDDMVAIAGGKFTMGPKTPAEVDDFCMDTTEVTVTGYAVCVSAGECSAPKTGPYCSWGVSGKDSHPINCVNWNQATTYCEWAGKRLPTEAQWEYAARGGAEQREFPWGSESAVDRACWKRPGRGTCEVRMYPPGAFGLFDMAGNVWEWVHDWHGSYPVHIDNEYMGPASGSSRVYRGGGWVSAESPALRGSGRTSAEPSFHGFFLGFRCARPQTTILGVF